MESLLLWVNYRELSICTIVYVWANLFQAPNDKQRQRSQNEAEVAMTPTEDVRTITEVADSPPGGKFYLSWG